MALPYPPCQLSNTRSGSQNVLLFGARRTHNYMFAGHPRKGLLTTQQVVLTLRFLERLAMLLLPSMALIGACAPVGDTVMADTNGGENGLVDADAGATSSSEPLDAQGVSSEAIFELVRTRTYRGAGFRALNSTPFSSTVSPTKQIALWVSERGYAALSQISSDNAGSGMTVPVGTVIVRDVLNRGVLDAITVMVKLPEGTFPLGGDYWYAAADPDGKIRLDAETKTPLAGLLANCGTCHLRRSSDDYIFGAPQSYLPKP